MLNFPMVAQLPYYIIYLYVSRFAIIDHLGTNYHFELCICSESALLYLPNALYCGSLFGSVSEIRLHKVSKYEKCVFT